MLCPWAVMLAIIWADLAEACSGLKSHGNILNYSICFSAINLTWVAFFYLHIT